MLCQRKSLSHSLRRCWSRLISLLNVSTEPVRISYARRSVVTSTISAGSKVLISLLAVLTISSQAIAADLDWVPRSVPASKLAGLVKAHKHHWYSLKHYQWDYKRSDNGEIEKMSKPVPNVPDLRPFAEAHPVRQFCRDFGPAIVHGLGLLIGGD